MSGTNSILVVDDDRAYCAALAGAFRRRGLEVAIASGYTDALAEAEVWQPQKAVIDMSMPGKNGLDLIVALKSHVPELSIVVLAAHGSIATAIEAVKLGANHYLTKPATADAILAAFEVSDEQGQLGSARATDGAR